MYGQGVTCIGVTDFPSQLANQSSQLYANNVSALMMVPAHTRPRSAAHRTCVLGALLLRHRAALS